MADKVLRSVQFLRFTCKVTGKWADSKSLKMALELYMHLYCLFSLETDSNTAQPLSLTAPFCGSQITPFDNTISSAMPNLDFNTRSMNDKGNDNINRCGVLLFLFGDRLVPDSSSQLECFTPPLFHWPPLPLHLLRILTWLVAEDVQVSYLILYDLQGFIVDNLSVSDPPKKDLKHCSQNLDESHLLESNGPAPPTPFLQICILTC
ncbi:hypothetical protein OUZ56_033556 [Daphnia magna]|uniref:Uncharacterized protein n=1 Tax=Daphnia magna TaxID=35525 RepID=A0ABR0BAT3_9CRUS|nr:hypothetical protein OUZ56_033556 [Daphnia magna]